MYVWVSHGFFHNQIYQCRFLKARADEAAIQAGVQAVAQADSPASLEKRGSGT